MGMIEAAFYDSSYRKCTFLNSLSAQKFYTNFFTLATRMKGMCFSKPVQRDSDLKFVSMIYNQRNLIILYIYLSESSLYQSYKTHGSNS